MDFLNEAQLGKLPAFAIALGIGLLIGLERERKDTARAGLRTFGLTSLFGALCMVLSEYLNSDWLLAAGLIGIAAMIIMAYADDGDPQSSGTTTAVALLVAYGLGALALIDETHLAVTLGLATTALLYFKTEFEGMMKRFDRRDLLSVIQFGALSVVVLPMLPDQGYGPYDVLNPYRIWLLVVLIAGLSLAGFLALRLIGGKRSAILLGIFGGMVSTTATTLSYSKHGRNADGMPLATLVILVANLVLLLRLGVVTAVVAPEFAFPYAWPVFATSFVAGAVVTFFFAGGLRPGEDLPVPKTNNPTELRAALTFGALFTAVLLLTAWLRDIAGDQGLYIAALVAGITDVDAITLSAMRLLEDEHVGARVTMITIVLALASNQATKLAFVWSIGGRALFARCVFPMAATAIAAAIATFAFIRQ